MSEVEDWIAEAQRSGVLESQGQFSLDLERSSQQLGLLQLPEPRAYILKLVQWAVRSRPTRVEVEANRKRVRVWHNGEPADFGEILKANTHLLQSGPLGHLAIGLNTARTLKPTALWMESNGHRVDLVPQVTIGPSSAPGTAVVLEGLPRRWFEKSLLVGQSAALHWHIIPRMFQLLPDSWGLSLPEVALVRQRCCYGSVPIFLNGKSVLTPINSRPSGPNNFVPTDGGTRGQKLRFLLADAQPGRIPCPASKVGRQQTDWLSAAPHYRKSRPILEEEREEWPRMEQVRFQEKPALAGHAAYYVHTSASGPGVISWLQDGVIVAETPIPGSTAWIRADASDLQTDLSQFRLVEDDFYRERLEWLLYWTP